VILSLANQIEMPLREKRLAGLLNRLPRTQPSLYTAGSTLEYLIGQQRQQFMPHCAAKSRANVKLMYAKNAVMDDGLTVTIF
jgi:hypothetical protein